MSYELTGKLHKKYETVSKSEKFQAREFVVETMDGSYNQYIKFQLTQDRCALVDDYNEGEQVKVHFDLRGREWNEKFFTNLNAWRLEKPAAAAASAPPPPPPAANESFPTQEPPAATGGNDDLPF